MIRSISSIALFALFTFAVGRAAAEPRSHASTPNASVNASPGVASIPDPSAASCTPSCRVGYTCVQGACVSACNPGCGEGEQCSSEGECIAKRATPIAPKRASYTPPPSIDDVPATPPPPVDAVDDASSTKRGVHTHDGFYLRVAIGPSYLTSTWKGGTQDASVVGAGGSFELAFGGTPVSGLVIGGGIFSNYASSPTLSFAGASANIGGASLTMVGPFVDWYPSPTNGFHLQASAGIAYAAYSPQATSGTSVSGTGFGMTAGIGYELWVGEQWSFGGTLRLQYATPSIKADGAADSSAIDSNAIVPALLIGATYH